MDVRVRTMKPDDAEAIVNILNPIITQGTYTLFDTPFSVESEREFLTQFPPRGIFHVAECCETSRVCGFQNLEPFAPYSALYPCV